MPNKSTLQIRSQFRKLLNKQERGEITDEQVTGWITSLTLEKHYLPNHYSFGANCDDLLEIEETYGARYRVTYTQRTRHNKTKKEYEIGPWAAITIGNRRRKQLLLFLARVPCNK